MGDYYHSLSVDATIMVSKNCPIISLFQALCQWRIEKAGRRRVGPGREKGEIPPSPFLSRIPLAADPACRPLAFSIVLTDREPGTGYPIIGEHAGIIFVAQ